MEQNLFATSKCLIWHLVSNDTDGLLSNNVKVFIEGFLTIKKYLRNTLSYGLAILVAKYP